MKIETSYGEVKLKKRDIEEHAERDNKVVSGQVAVVIAGNGVTWQPEGFIWLHPHDAYELQEANGLQLIDEYGEPDEVIKKIGPYTVYAYELPN
jgi:hypothetical protein